MSLVLYNSLKKREEEFVPLKNGIVTMYTCGPTVYSRPHIGNYSSFLMADLLRRWLEVLGYEVKHVKNITDVGHLVADSDSGEDKIEKQARAEKTDPLEVARKYTVLYLDDEKFLGFLEPYARPRATETIPEMLGIIGQLMQKGCAYETDDGVYFDVTKCPRYGELSGNTLEHLSAGARIAVDEKKRHPADFALWKKTVGPNAAHILRWPSPWGEGFPGWHIECSAMSTKFLGTTIDIHTGGEDNIFPHHECEIAQSECAAGKPFVRYWVHRRRIDVDAGEEGIKMSKSLGNVLSLPDVIERGYDPMDLRYLLLSVHYRTRLKFSWKGLDDARKARRKILEWIDEILALDSDNPGVGDIAVLAKKARAHERTNAFVEAMNADLNASGALAAVFDLMAWSRNQHQLTAPDRAALISFIHILRHTFGCFPEQRSTEALPPDAQALADERERARASKDFANADRLRDALKALGYEARDTSDGQVVKKL